MHSGNAKPYSVPLSALRTEYSLILLILRVITLENTSKNLNASKLYCLKEARHIMKMTHMVLFRTPGGRTSSRHQPPAEAQSDRSSLSEKAPNCLHE